ncbi:hypothetical protein [Paraburkholderia azotifigens]|uniref:Uncharacterized protein n=1 Tax=Paraburkholderia azotifigens TaxID=2057004 RepID=A0ABU9QZH6_9BURK
MRFTFETAQLKVRTKVLMQHHYGDTEKDEESFRTFIVQMEERLGSEFCEPGSLSSHSKDIRRGIDGRCGLAVRVATDALSQHGSKHKLNWDLYKKYLDELAETAGNDLAMERCATNKPIVAAAEATITQRKPKHDKIERSGRVVATKNTNAANHPFA